MKTILLSTFLAIGVATAQAQDIATDAVPSVVRNSFQQQFPRVNDVEWEMEGNLYNVDFEVGTIDHEAWYDASGKLIKHAHDISYQELPESIKTTLAKQFASYRYTDLEKIDTQGTYTFKLEAEKGNDEHKLLIDANGKILQDWLDD